MKANTFNAGLERFRSDQEDVRCMRNQMFEIWARLERERFRLSGGCIRCAGRGTIVRAAHDRIPVRESMFVRCPEADCTPESRSRTGLNLSYESTYDPNRGLYLNQLRANDRLYRTFVKMYDDILEGIRRKMTALVR